MTDHEKAEILLAAMRGVVNARERLKAAKDRLADVIQAIKDDPATYVEPGKAMD